MPFPFYAIMPRMNFHVITLFPEVCKTYTDSSILGRAQKVEKGKGAKHRGKRIEVKYYNPRDFTTDKHHKTDDRPYGGGPGMVMYAEPILSAWKKAVGKSRRGAKRKIKTLIMSPRGKKFDGTMAKQLADRYEHLVLISGRYEGIDARVKKILKAEEVSVGDYVLTGGELPALSIIDSVARQIPGVLGRFDSLEDERDSRFSGGPASGEVYTRPRVLEYKRKKYKVPAVLLGGNHAEIEKWKQTKMKESSKSQMSN
jgi:tRNA (guanine37-N1)-methyltransferase